MPQLSDEAQRNLQQVLDEMRDLDLPIWFRNAVWGLVEYGYETTKHWYGSLGHLRAQLKYAIQHRIRDLGNPKGLAERIEALLNPILDAATEKR